MLTDGCGRLPFRPPLPRRFPVPVLVVGFRLGRPLTGTPFRVVTGQKPGSLTSLQPPEACVTSQKTFGSFQQSLFLTTACPARAHTLKKKLRMDLVIRTLCRYLLVF